MTLEEFQRLPEAQKGGVRKIQERTDIPFEQFIHEECHAPTNLSPYVSIPDFHGMFVGVEPDGHTHT